MHDLTASELLTVWERGRSQPSYRQALLMLSVAFPERTAEDLASMSVGRRDTLLLSLRERLFGQRLESITDCPSCGEKLDLCFNIFDIRLESEDEDPQLSLKLGGYEIGFKLPDSNDLTAIAAGTDYGQGREILLDRCLTEVRLDGKNQPVSTLPEEVVDTVIKRMADADPQADVQLSLDCPTCRHHWLAIFDIVSFLWREIDSLAKRILGEAHILARSYGWREADILAMSALRRQLYIEMLAK